ncbi:MAG: hypothetical protein A2X94_17460 [Bdellovibrionales bacterium GWB1_55_8]|nr:MAG: hypothetical protein A2X94_17460 [Bdellovibrionales bacterium GWB1_55_8]
MVAKFLLKLASEPFVSKRDIVLTLLPALIWTTLVLSRPVLIETICATEPAKCTAESVVALDRIAIGLDVSGADAFSYWTQNTSGVLAGTVPAIWHASLAVAGRITPMTALLYTGVDLLIFIQTTAWNGALNEAVRVASQRPRPFVYSDPVGLGSSPAHYVSFYSGHTSYSAAMMVTLLLILLSRGAPLWLMGATLAVGQGLVIATAVFRVLAGRHFITDVLTAAVMGTLVAIAVAYFHRKKPGSQSELAS